MFLLLVLWVLQIGSYQYKMVVGCCRFILSLVLILRAFQFILLGFLVISSIADNDTSCLLLLIIPFVLVLWQAALALAFWKLIK